MSDVLKDCRQDQSARGWIKSLSHANFGTIAQSLPNIFFLLILLLLSSSPLRTAQASLPPGSGSFWWTDTTGASHPDKPLEVFYYRPAVVTATTPVWFIMHGTERNADEYRDYFIRFAAEQGALVIAPKFDSLNWPGTSGYNLGNISQSSTDAFPQDERDWSFSKIEPLFDYLREELEPTIAATHYSMFGHSAGAHFVHRFLIWKPQARVNLAIAANAGWYTLPQLRDDRYPHDWPYSLSNAPLSPTAPFPVQDLPPANVESAFRRRMVVLLGDQDLIRDEYLSTSPEAEAQGANRLERGLYFFSHAESEALAQHVQFDWTLQIVPGVGHSGLQMASTAARLFQLADLPDDEFRQCYKDAVNPEPSAKATTTTTPEKPTKKTPSTSANRPAATKAPARRPAPTVRRTRR